MLMCIRLCIILVGGWVVILDIERVVVIFIRMSVGIYVILVSMLVSMVELLRFIVLWVGGLESLVMVRFWSFWFMVIVSIYF